jgi:hypothetical protein
MLELVPGRSRWRGFKIELKSCEAVGLKCAVRNEVDV